MTSTGEIEGVTDARKAAFRLSDMLQIWRALDLVWRSAPRLTMANAVLVLILGVLPLASLYLTKLIVDSVSRGSGTASFEGTLMLIAMAGGVALLIALCSSADKVVSEAQAAQVLDGIQDLLHAKSAEVDLEYYENSQYYDALHRAQEDAPSRPMQIVRSLVDMGQSGISLTAMVALLFALNWGLAGVLMVSVFPGVLVRLKYANKIYRWQRGSTPLERRAWYHHWMLTSDEYAKEVRLFDLGDLFKSRYREIRNQLRREYLDITAKRSAVELLAQISAVIAVFGSLAYVAYRASQGTITLGDMVMYFGAFQQGQASFKGLLVGMAGLYEDNLFLTSLYEFLDLEPKVKEPESPKPLPKPILGGIAFENVRFCYPNSNKRVLDGISLKIEPGQAVALVGENGSGKTTLVKILCRLYDPSAGTVTLDGINLRDFKISDLRRQMTVLFQDFACYNLTAFENIWLGNVSNAGDAEVSQAAERSQADQVIKRLKHGYKTVLGGWFEGGADLSIGEWQKVALARAFLRDAQIVILDEPTSSLDPRAEDEIFEMFWKLIEGKTAVIISHRLSTVKMADCIYFLKDGKISERGTHQELMALSGDYARLFEIQAKHYR
ncbi:MAG TPA: ABC transporter ATP-binding protein [Methanotrichaceae archaeon]|nr:ABC transporter ATP-binding protein [Methanotrichaceae archaeon]